MNEEVTGDMTLQLVGSNKSIFAVKTTVKTVTWLKFDVLIKKFLEAVCLVSQLGLPIEFPDAD